MKDRDIRACLRAELEAEHVGDDDTLILDELGLLQGAARVDMAVVNGTLCAWEIKSERDTLRRLPGQVEAYSKVFDRVTLVVSQGHAVKADRLIPPWWGLRIVTQQGEEAPRLEHAREAELNPGADPRALAELLWRDEVLELLASYGLDVGLRGKPRRVLWAALVDAIDLPALADHVRDALKARQGWRADRPRP